MKVTVKLFAGARESAGSEAAELEVDSPARVRDLLKALDALYPGLGLLSGRWAVNLNLVSLDRLVASEDEVAFLPPMSGG